jgi:hypothetical protein
MANQRFSGLCLVLAGILFLSAYGKLNQFWVLLPICILLAFAILAGCGLKTMLSAGMKKR